MRCCVRIIMKYLRFVGNVFDILRDNRLRFNIHIEFNKHLYVFPCYRVTAAVLWRARTTPGKDIEYF